MADAINAHKKMAMGITEGNVMKKGGKVRKYANGGGVGAVPESKARTLMNDSSQKQPLPKPTGKIATLKGGGQPKRGPGLTIAIGIPVKKAAGRGR